MSADEDGLLDMAGARRSNSRLSCRIEFFGGAGSTVTLAPED